MLIYFVYRLFGILALPLILLYFLKRGLTDRRYWKGLGERFGQTPPHFHATVPGGIWLHAVSVGEVISAVELLKRLRAGYPNLRLFVSVTTVAGRAIAVERLGPFADAIFHAPVDLAWVVRRVLRRLRPQVVVVMETEIWPNLYREAKRFGCGLVIVNGRISDRAFPSYLRWRFVFDAALRWPDAILAQNSQAAGRYRQLGAPPGRITIAGNLKYDFQPSSVSPPPVVRSLIDRVAPAQIWIAASTMPPFAADDPDEDHVVIDTFRELAARHPKLLCILVPRRPERFDAAAAKLSQAGIPFLRRSQLGDADDLALPGVLLLDSMGELSSLFPLAAVVFMGGTLARRGGHNILEPAFVSVPVVIGPHMENFPDIAAEFRANHAVREIAGPRELAAAMTQLLNSEADRKALGEAGRRLAESKRGATSRAIACIADCYRDSLPMRPHSWIHYLLLAPLSLLWKAGVHFDRARKSRTAARLESPVISVGGLSMGGAGKTPMTALLAENLSRRGLRPAILTRGYGRRTLEKNTVLDAGASCSTARTGDEAQIFLRRGHAALGVGPDRVASARLLEARAKPDVWLLDDGLQHWRIQRDVDLVLIDGLDPFGGGHLFPLGMQREPVGELARASAFLVTRYAGPLRWRALESQLRRHQPDAPIHYCRTVPEEWVNVKTGERLPPEAFAGAGAAAFCGLGNPASFWKTLADLGVVSRFQWDFGDHHSYKPREMRRLIAQAVHHGVRILLTTEKDFVNLPADPQSVAGDVEFHWLRMRLEIDHEREFMDWLADRIGRSQAGQGVIR